MFEPLSTLIRTQREAQGLTIDQLAKLAGVSRTRLITLEKGDDNISLKLLLRITNALQMTKLHIGGLGEKADAPTRPLDPEVAATLAEAIRVADKIFDQVLACRDELDRVNRRVKERLAEVIKPE